MAAGDTLANSGLLPPFVRSGSLATEDERNNHILRTFDDSGQDEYQFRTFLPSALSANPVGITLILIWAASTTVGNVRWEAKIERLNGVGSDIDSDSFASARSSVVAVPATSGVLKYSPINYTAGVQMDNAGREEMIRVHIRRDGTHVDDTAEGRAQLLGWAIKETSGPLGPSGIPGLAGSDRIQFVDNFAMRYPAAGTALDATGASHWLKTETLGLGVISATDGPGVALGFGAVSEIAVAEILGAKMWDIDKGPVFEFDVEINDIGDLAALDISIGVSDGTLGNDADAVPVTALFHLDGAALSIFCESDDGINEVPATDSTIDAVANTRIRLTIDFTTKSGVVFKINGTPMLTQTVFDMSAYSGLLGMVVNIEKTLDDTTARVTLRRAAVDIAI